MVWILIIIIVVILYVVLSKKSPPKTPCGKPSSDRKNPQNLRPVIVQEKKEEQIDHILDPSSAQIIELPQLPKPDFDEDRKPQEYWNVFYKGVDYYNRAWYAKAREELLKLRGYKEPHKTYFTYLLRTFRKIIAKAIENQKLQEAYDAYKEFFTICEAHITDTDQRNYNKLIEKLLQKKPDAGYQKIEIQKREIEPDFEIVPLNNYTITLISDMKEAKENRPQKTTWNFTDTTGTGTVYVKGVYNEEQAKYDKAFIRMRDNTGTVIKEFNAEHGIYRFKAAAGDSGKFIASSDDLMLYLYSIQNGCMGTYPLRGYAENKYHIRCVDISPEGRFLLFTHIDKAYLMDSDLRVLGQWRTPHKEGWERRSEQRLVDKAADRTTEYLKNLSILGLAGRPTTEEIKKAFRYMIRKYHPDINPDEPEAEKNTIEILNAYEKLTGEEANQALKGIENAEYFYKLMNRFKVEIPGTTMSFTVEIGMVGPGEDWIYGTGLSPNGDRIYLGCYSGKVYCVGKDGRVLKLYNSHDTINAIREKGNSLFIETSFHLYVLKDDVYITHVGTWQEGELRWYREGFMFVKAKEVRLFADAGIEIGKIIFKNPIYDLYWIDKDLQVHTATKVFRFSFVPPIC
ncbi:MAG: DnaJ domain-containing protein [Thermodesulfovibrionales bacterium]